jgi:hypothetical protein
MSRVTVFRTPTCVRTGVFRKTIDPPTFRVTARFSYLGQRWEVSMDVDAPEKGQVLDLASVIEAERTAAVEAFQTDLEAFLAERQVIE